MKYIYLYTTQTYQDKNWYKIGQSIKNPSKRIKEQDNSSNPEPLITISYWEVPDSVTDKKIHKQLDKLGFPRIRSSREWFELSDTPSSDIESILSELGDFETVEPQKSLAPIFTIPDVSEMWWFRK